jgi:predicted N-acetyltransferase YhbS
MKTEVIIKKGKELTQKEINLMDNARIADYGENTKMFKKDEQKSIFFFVKSEGQIVSFGMLKPIKMTYLGKKYNLLGIGNILSIKKGKGFGKILIHSMIEYLKMKGKTGLGFCGKSNVLFYKKAGFETRNKFSFRFVLKNPWTGKITPDDENCTGIYSNGRDDFIKKVISTKSVGYYWVPRMECPHW